MSDRYFIITKLLGNDDMHGVKIGDTAKFWHTDSEGCHILYNPGSWDVAARFFCPSQLEEVPPPGTIAPCDAAANYLYRKASTIMKSMLCRDDCGCSRCAAAQDWIASFPTR